MTTRLQDLAVTKVTLCGSPINQDAEILLYKAEDPKGTEPQDTKEAAPVADEISKADLDAVTAERDALAAEIQALKDMDPNDVASLLGLELAKAEEEDVLKSLPDEVRERIEKAEARVAKMEADSRKAEFVKKATDDYGVEDEDFGPVLEAVDRLLPDEMKKAHERVVKALAAQAKAGDLFSEAGGNKPAGDDLFAVVKSRAAVIAKEEGIGETEALQKAMAENADKAHEALSK